MKLTLQVQKVAMFPLILKVLNMRTKSIGNGIQKEVLGKMLFPTRKKITDLNPQDYGAIYFTGGHGVLWDYPEDKELMKVAEAIYYAGGFITSVCHGTAGLLNLKDEEGQYLIKDKVVTGFTNEEEELNGTATAVPFLTETELNQRGARYKKAAAFKEYAIRDGRIITGQNPQSPQKVAELLVAELRKLNH